MKKKKKLKVFILSVQNIWWHPRPSDETSLSFLYIQKPLGCNSLQKARVSANQSPQRRNSDPRVGYSFPAIPASMATQATQISKKRKVSATSSTLLYFLFGFWEKKYREYDFIMYAVVFGLQINQNPDQSSLVSMCVTVRGRRSFLRGA